MVTGALTILLVDDNSEFTGRLIELVKELSGIGNIMIARSYDEGATIFHQEKPGVILLDIHLRGRTGVEFIKHIRGAGRVCSILVMSNHADEQYRRFYLHAGADYFFDKTYEFPLIPETLRKIAAQK